MTESLPRVYTPAEIDTRNLILHLRARKWRYLLISFLMGIYFFYLFKFHVLDYSSTATFIVNDRSFLAASLGIEGLTGNDNFNRIYELANSIQTQLHLIKKFDLIKLYEIDTTREFYMQSTIAMIRSKITVSKSPMNTISITVKDSHRYLAAEMANEIVSYVETLNHDYYVANIQKRLEISKVFTAQLEEVNKGRIERIESIIDKLNMLALKSKADDQTRYQLLSQQVALGEIINSYKTSTNDLLTSQKMNAMALQALNFQTFATTTIVQEAMPAVRSTNYTAAMFSAGAMLAVLLLLVMQAYFYMSYKHYITLMLTGR
jgi:capsular polysaccharide biosynthesis protein